jgi:hypothetical protein
MRNKALQLLLPATLMFAACVGEIGDDGSSGSSGDGAGGEPGPGPGSKSCATKGIGPGVLRRLTGDELRGTIQDLAGIGIDDIQLQPDLEVAEFQSNADSPTQWTNAVDLRDVAEKVGMYIRNNVQEYAPCDPVDVPAEKACVDAYLDDFGKRAFRRPLTEDERSRLQALYDKARSEHALQYPGGIRLVTEALLQSPAFAYHVEIGMDVAAENGAVPLTGHEMASRLSYFLLGTMPDEELFQAAESGALGTEAGVAAQVDRLLDMDAGKAHVGGFFRQWLGLADVGELTRSTDQFPTWTDETAASMRASTEMFLDDVMWNGDGLYSTMLTSPVSYVNGPLAQVLGLEGSYGSDFERVELPAGERPGILSHPSILARTSHSNQTSPVHRGLFVRSRMLCGAPPPPPPELMVNPLPLDPGLTTRERLEEHVKNETCQGCHKYMDPIGLAIEKYDAIGAHREEENSKPIDASGQIVESDVDEPFDGLAGLTDRLAASNDAAVCAERKMMTFALGRDLVKGELCWLGDDYMDATPDELDFRELARAIATSQPFRMVRKPDTTECQ